jgi:hypothetical protein
MSGFVGWAAKMQLGLQKLLGRRRVLMDDPAVGLQPLGRVRALLRSSTGLLRRSLGL